MARDDDTAVLPVKQEPVQDSVEDRAGTQTERSVLDEEEMVCVDGYSIINMAQILGIPTLQLEQMKYYPLEYIIEDDHSQPTGDSSEPTRTSVKIEPGTIYNCDDENELQQPTKSPQNPTNKFVFEFETFGSQLKQEIINELCRGVVMDGINIGTSEKNITVENSIKSIDYCGEKSGQSRELMSNVADMCICIDEICKCDFETVCSKNYQCKDGEDERIFHFGKGYSVDTIKYEEIDIDDQETPLNEHDPIAHHSDSREREIRVEIEKLEVENEIEKTKCDFDLDEKQYLNVIVKEEIDMGFENESQKFSKINSQVSLLRKVCSRCNECYWTNCESGVHICGNGNDWQNLDVRKRIVEVDTTSFSGDNDNLSGNNDNLSGNNDNRSKRNKRVRGTFKQRINNDKMSKRAIDSLKGISKDLLGILSKRRVKTITNSAKNSSINLNTNKSAVVKSNSEKTSKSVNKSRSDNLRTKAVTKSRKDCNDSNLKSRNRYKPLSNSNSKSKIALSSKKLVKIKSVSNGNRESKVVNLDTDLKSGEESKSDAVKSTIEPKKIRSKVKMIYDCDECSYKTKYLRSLEAHKSLHKKKGLFPCDECSNVCYEEGEYEKHRLTHELEKNYSCSKCRFQCRYLWMLRQHGYTHFKGEILADSNDKIEKEGFESSNETGNESDCSTQSDGGKKDKVRKEYKLAQVFNPVNVKKVFKNVSYNGDLRFKCKLCNFSSLYMSGLRFHKLRHSGKLPYQCTLCSYACLHPTTLKRHILVHTQAKPFKCDQCKFACNIEYNLKLHKYIHTQERPHKCQHCEKTFNHRNALTSHQLTHITTRKFFCESCDYSCNRFSSMKRHWMTHVVKFFCPKCTMTSRKFSSFLRHMIIEHKEGHNYVCPICGFASLNRRCVLVHKSVHNHEKESVEKKFGPTNRSDFKLVDIQIVCQRLSEDSMKGTLNR